MSKFSTAKSILTEFGVGWAFFRTLYSLKLKLLCTIPKSEAVFEKNVSVKRIDIFTTDTASMAEFLKSLPESDRQGIIKGADDAAEGRIKEFSSVELDYGNPPQWQINPLSKISCRKDLKWYRIKDFDSERGDIKLVWEASRFTHFYLFARAYMLTRDSRYYEAFSSQLEDWLANNPYSYGANYKCGQECALRMINTLRVFSVFDSFGLITQKDRENVAETVRRCYKKILSNFFYAHRCIRNNHTLSELCGMIIGAWCCEDSHTLAKAYRMFDKEICSQFTPDGGYRQFSFNYQRLAMQICECVLTVSERTGRSPSAAARELMKKSALLLFECQNDDGDLPNYGSNDGALIFPVTACGYRDFRPVINTLYASLTKSRLFPAGKYDEELFWFGKMPQTEAAPARASSAFPQAGLYTLRGDDCFAMICLCNFTSRPAHMDQMHFDLWYRGENIFCDCGTYSYASELGQKLTLTESHNTVLSAKAGQMNRHGNFMICNWSKASGIRHTSDSFDGVMTSRNGYTHRRSVQMNGNIFTLTDETENAGKYEILFHTPAEITLTDGAAVLSIDGRLVCTVKCDNGEMYVTEGRRSLYYLQNSKISVLHITCNNIKVTTVIELER